MSRSGETFEHFVARLSPQAAAGGTQPSPRAIAALLAASPQLSNIGNLPAGAVVVVPDLPARSANSVEIITVPTLMPSNLVRVLGGQATALGTAVAPGPRPTPFTPVAPDTDDKSQVTRTSRAKKKKKR